MRGNYTKTTFFFDLEKAYETTWRYGILNDLHNIGLIGRLPNFMIAFLSDRKFNPIKHPKSRRGTPSGEYTISNPLQHKNQ